MKMIGLKAKRYSWDSMSIHKYVKTTAMFNKSIIQPLISLSSSHLS